MRILHQFISPKSDGPDTTLVKPTDWNDPHDILTDADGVILGRPAGAGPGQVQEIPFRALGIFNESVLAAAAAELIVTVPASAKYVELQFLTSNSGNVSDVLTLNAMNGSTVINVPAHNTQLLLGSGATANGGFAGSASGWNLGTLAAAQGRILPMYITLGSPHQVLGTGQLWGINSTGTRFAIQAAFDGGGSVEPTGYRLSNGLGSSFAVGSYLRSLCIQ